MNIKKKYNSSLLSLSVMFNMAFETEIKNIYLFNMIETYIASNMKRHITKEIWKKIDGYPGQNCFVKVTLIQTGKKAVIRQKAVRETSGPHYGPLFGPRPRYR